MMKHLFTPWRMKFIKEGKHANGCILCSLLELTDGQENLILRREERTFTMMNKYPYNVGHLMVVPLNHKSDYTHLTAETLKEMHLSIQHCVRVLDQVYQPQGYNIGINIGKAGGAGIPDHLHYHIVPRWTGDTNFMPLFAQTRVLPETIEETFDKLSPHF